MKRIKTLIDDNGFTFHLEIQDTKLTIPQRLDKLLPQGITAYWTVFNKNGEGVFGTPVVDKDYKVIAFKTEAEAEKEALKFMGF